MLRRTLFNKSGIYRAAPCAAARRTGVIDQDTQRQLAVAQGDRGGMPRSKLRMKARLARVAAVEIDRAGSCLVPHFGVFIGAVHAQADAGARSACRRQAQLNFHRPCGRRTDRQGVHARRHQLRAGSVQAFELGQRLLHQLDLAAHCTHAQFARQRLCAAPGRGRHLRVDRNRCAVNY